MLGLAKRDIGVDHPLKEQSLEVVPVETLFSISTMFLEG
ncbi:hypothetical protein HZ326_28838, partial [Fusarium oxysporum f. sp. albedinis]